MDTSWKRNTCTAPILPGLNPQQQKALELLLSYMDADSTIQDIHWAAYMLGTIQHETAGTFRPIKEYGMGKGRAYGVEINYKGVPHIYAGRGYVQITWLVNYQRLGKAIGLDDQLADKPDLALQPEIAYKIASVGMVKGLFTGKKLADFELPDGTYDYLHARRIINGLSGADVIAEKAKKMEAALRVRP